MTSSTSGRIVLAAHCDYAARYGKGLEFQAIVESLEKEQYNLRVTGIFRDRGEYNGKYNLINALPGGNTVFKAIVFFEKVLCKIGVNLPARHIQDKLFDWSAARRIPRDCSVLMTLPSMTRVLKRAKALGAKTIAHGVVMHPAYNLKLLAQTYSDPSKYPAVYNYSMIAESDRSMGFFDKVICPSVTTFQSYVENGFSAENVFLVPLGYERPVLKPDILPWGNNGRLKIIFVGNITAMKGVDVIFKAIPLLDENRFEFHFCGEVQQDMADELIRLQRSCSNFIFHGYIPSLKVMPKCHVFCFLSLSEGQPKALLEAAYCGLLIISNKEFNADVVYDKETGFFCDQSPDELSSVLEDIERSRDKYIGLRRQVQKKTESLTWERFGNGVKDVLLEIIKREVIDTPSVQNIASSGPVR